MRFAAPLTLDRVPAANRHTAVGNALTDRTPPHAEAHLVGAGAGGLRSPVRRGRLRNQVSSTLTTPSQPVRKSHPERPLAPPPAGPQLGFGTETCSSVNTSGKQVSKMPPSGAWLPPSGASCCPRRGHLQLGTARRLTGVRHCCEQEARDAIEDLGLATEDPAPRTRRPALLVVLREVRPGSKNLETTPAVSEFSEP